MQKVKSFFRRSYNAINNALDKFTKKEAIKTIITSLWCALFGLLIGFIVLLLINPGNAIDGIAATLKNFFIFSSNETRLRYFGSTLAKTAPLIVMSLSILFGCKCGLFNIGASGQYTIAFVVVLFAGLAGNLPWYLVMILAMLAGAIYAAITGLLKAFFNVSEVISGIMLNWIALYFANGICQTNSSVWDASKGESFKILQGSPAFLPNIGIDKLFSNNPIAGIGILFAVLAAVVIFLLLKKTTFGYEVQAIGLNSDASNYAGMSKIKSTIISTAICGALAGLAASLNAQNGFTSWQLSSNIASIGFDGISSAFLGGLSPIGAIFSSYFITHIMDGGSVITDLGYAPQVSNIMTSSIIYLSGFVAFIKHYINEKDLVREQKLLSRQKVGEEKN